MTKQVQVYNPPYCQCRTVQLGGGDVEIVTEHCGIHGPGLPADSLVSSLPFKSEVDMWRDYDAIAERVTTPRAIFTRIPLDIPEVDDLYRGRYGRQ